ncbi:MAG: LiaF transmembrane domain-containing protein [Candidatus Saccharicenans sp.]|nr:MAG: hypothetical protein C0168_04810 [Candidatus Aminicenantes bacterium]HEK85184.1 hypothetical protein [Candidatus Aminicenantes bacterium]
MSSRGQESRLFWGLFLLIIGILFLLEQLGYLNFGRVASTYWPAIFILIGFSIYLGRGFKKSGTAFLLILLGSFMLLVKLRVIERYLWRYFWPSLIIIVGLWIIFKPRAKGSS